MRLNTFQCSSVCSRILCSTRSSPTSPSAIEGISGVSLVTVHKLYRGFFNGERRLDIFQLDRIGGPHVFFLDEFDFLRV